MSERLHLQAVELTYQSRVVELNVNGETYVTPYQSSLYGPGLEVNRELHKKINAALNAAEQAGKERELLAKMADLLSDEDWQGSYAMHAVKNKLLAEYAVLQTEGE